MRATSKFRPQPAATLIAAFVAAALVLAPAATGCRPESVIPPPDSPGTTPGTTPGDPDGPNIPKPPGEEHTVSIAYLKTLYNGAPLLITDEIAIAGAVVSSDREGNFHNTLVLDDGTGGIEVRLDIEQIFKEFWIHSRATVRCNGLWLGSYGGTLQLGDEPFGDFQTRPLSEIAVAEHIFADTTFYGEVRPRVLTFDELSQRHISTFVAFDEVSFVEQGLPWAETEVADLDPNADPAGDPEAEPPAATNRHIADSRGNTLIVRTSRYARFASRLLPKGRGRIEGIVGYFNGDYQLVVCDAQKFEPVRE